MADSIERPIHPKLNLGISISESGDLGRLGLTESHIRIALGELARAMLLAHGRITYGGHLDPNGYTQFLVTEVERYGSRDRPLMAYVPYSEHFMLSGEELTRRVESIGLLGKYIFLDPAGEAIDPSIRGAAEVQPISSEVELTSLHALRDVIVRKVDARVVLGGARHRSVDGIPGVAQEAIMSVRRGKPLFIAGGFGGVASDLARAVRLDPADWLLVGREADYAEEFLRAGHETSWSVESNGLSLEESRRLATTYRASEIASLVVVGLKRLTRAGNPP